MWPYSELGIEPTTDERTIKRAYAVKLKQNRPDENPEGFQRLHEAYQAALQRCQATNAPTMQAPHATVPPRPLPPLASVAAAPAAERTAPPATAPAPVTFDADAFLHEAIAQADANEPGLLRRWLESHEALWSLSLKARVGQRWLAVVHQAAPPMPDGCFDEMLAFFRLDHAGAVGDPLALAQRRQRMHLSWYLAPERRNALARVLGANTVTQRKQTMRALDRLQRPFRWPVALLQTLLPQTVRTMNHLILRLAGNPPVELPPPVNPRQQAFWLQAAHSGLFSRTGLAIAGTRAGAGMLVSILIGAIFSSIPAIQGQGFDWSPGIGMVAVGAMICSVALAMAAWSELTVWQRRFVPTKGALGWLHFALVPMLSLAGLAIIDATALPMAGWVLAVPALWLALARLLHGRTMPPPYRNWLRVGIFLIYPASRLLAGAIEVPTLVGNALAGAALLAWGIDAWRRRPIWRRATA